MRYVAGSVELDGKKLPIWDDSKMNAFRFKEVSIIPQYALSALNPTRRIGTMAMELLRSRNIEPDTVLPEFKRRLKLVGLDQDVLDRFPIELSGGMKQRVVMVLSSLLDPSLLIADEVTSALDVSTQRAVSELLVEFRDRGFVKSMIVITHDLSVLYQIADTILIMYAGKLAEKAPAETVVNSPRHPYTQLLLSSLPEVGVRYAEKRLSGIPGRPPPLIDPCDLLRDVLSNAGLIEPLPNHNQWHIFVDPETVDIDLFDFPDIVGDLVEDALTNAVVAIIPGGWVRDLILELIGGIADVIRFILDIPDEIDEWLSDLFNVSFGLFDFLVTLVLDLFGHCVPIHRIDDPFTVLEEEVSTSVRLDKTPVTLVPVKVPVRNLSVRCDDVEMIVQADIGA